MRRAHVADSGSRVLVTMDSYYRSGTLLDHKEKADEAVKTAAEEGQVVDKVLVWRRYPGQYHSATPMQDGRDYFVDNELKTYAGSRIEPVALAAEEPLFLMYTSGTTGRPKGCQHSTGGYLSYVAGTSKYVQDIHPEDVYWCMADIGWITGHSYIVYGPLSLAATTVMYEGVPTYPDAGRAWRIAEQLAVNIFHTAPTTIRMLRKAGPDEPQKYNYHFKHMTTVVARADGYYRILGRVDDVINVAGHRLGTKELESAGLTVEEIAEAAVVPVADDIRGRVPDMYVSLKPGFDPGPAIEAKVTQAIETIIGQIARPKHVYIVPDMPKTRSGKIMRRVLAAISNTMDIGDVTTLANPEVVESVRQMVQGESVVVTQEGPEDLKHFGEEP
ncbi:Acetyl-coenzyme A synthetase [Geodia barretti]|uniref:acetate--CoA ligase n=1 Tax=Geodia barretti TaxID=519541 RepID=A0AA35TKF5_GEOBA|nr:Acetyl-coenzyme A synthetase [Geodia barretti]